MNAYPQWDEDYSQTPIKLSENAPRDYIVKRMKAQSTMLGNPYVNYIIQQGDTPSQNGPPVHFHSRIDESTNEMLLMVYNPLDFEVIPKFTLTIKAAVSFSSLVLAYSSLFLSLHVSILLFWHGGQLESPKVILILCISLTIVSC